MKRRLLSCFFVLTLILSLVGQAYGSDIYSINKINNNSISVEKGETQKNMRILVEKGDLKYYYSFNNKVESIPLQLGRGIYTVKVLENISGNRYKVVSKKDIDKTAKNQLSTFLQSNQPIYWKDNEGVLKLGEELTKGKNTQEEKIKAIYEYIIKNIEYDFDKIPNLENDYVPDLTTVLDSKSGICYDYSALAAGILRSQGIPTKLVKGYKNDLKGYHAWNEVYFNGKWQIIDTTYDAAFAAANIKQNMIKMMNEYSKTREY